MGPDLAWIQGATPTPEAVLVLGEYGCHPSVFSLAGKSGSSSREGCVMRHLAVWEQKSPQ